MKIPCYDIAFTSIACFKLITYSTHFFVRTIYTANTPYS